MKHSVLVLHAKEMDHTLTFADDEKLSSAVVGRAGNPFHYDKVVTIHNINVDNLSDVYRMTNHIDESWEEVIENPFELHRSKNRSTSIGDVFFVKGTGQIFIVAPCGYLELTGIKWKVLANLIVTKFDIYNEEGK